MICPLLELKASLIILWPHAAIVPPSNAAARSKAERFYLIGKRSFLLNFHAVLRAAPPRMKARIAPCLQQSTLPLRSVLNKRSTFHFGRCWTRAIGTQQPSSYLGFIKCAGAGSNKFAPAPAHLITFIVKAHIFPFLHGQRLHSQSP